MTEGSASWHARGCTIGGAVRDTWCGEPIVGAVMVRTYELPLALMLDEPRAAAVLVCRRHWDALTAPAPTPGEALA